MSLGGSIAPRRRRVTALSIVAVVTALALAAGVWHWVSTQPVVPTACIAAMDAAAQEGAATETALLATLDACVTADSWISALRANPAAGVLTGYTREEALDSLDAACVRRVDAPVCVDASEQGMLTYELDDPRLTELQIPR